MRVPVPFEEGYTETHETKLERVCLGRFWRLTRSVSELLSGVYPVARDAGCPLGKPAAIFRGRHIPGDWSEPRVSRARSEEGPSQAEQRTVGTEIAAPEVLHQQRRQHQHADYDDSGLADEAKEFLPAAGDDQADEFGMC